MRSWEKFRDAILKILGGRPDGMRHAELHRLLRREFPEKSKDAITGGMRTARLKTAEIQQTTDGKWVFRHAPAKGAVRRSPILPIRRKQPVQSLASTDQSKPVNLDRVKNKKKQVVQAAISILRKHSGGLRNKDLENAVAAILPQMNPNTRGSYVVRLAADIAPAEVYKTGEGLFRLRESLQSDETSLPIKRIRRPFFESMFYAPFAKFLKATVADNGLGECTVAESVGETRGKSKWSSPDVIGVLKPASAGGVQKKTAFYNFLPEIISAEIKIAVDSGALVAAFGQACAYRRFSHKSYLVIPSAAPDLDIERLDSLGTIFGIGLVLFDRHAPTEPKWSIRVRARKQEPDLRHVDEYIADLNGRNSALVEKLFGG